LPRVRSLAPPPLRARQRGKVALARRSPGALLSYASWLPGWRRRRPASACKAVDRVAVARFLAFTRRFPSSSPFPNARFSSSKEEDEKEGRPRDERNVLACLFRFDRGEQKPSRLVRGKMPRPRTSMRELGFILFLVVEAEREVHTLRTTEKGEQRAEVSVSHRSRRSI